MDEGLSCSDGVYGDQLTESNSRASSPTRSLSKYDITVRNLYTWIKHQRKVMNAGKMQGERVKMFEKKDYSSSGLPKSLMWPSAIISA